MSTAPSPETFELQAEQQRHRIQKTALELISKVDHAKEQLAENLSLKHQVKKHFGVAVLITSGVAFFLGYSLVAGFKRH
ncbi:MAG TPA: hypothetical protein VMX38_07130 [Verrucomicrobiae bacterium]|jgi:hypothetical protein|nr:hypothetical protein [Verrucomicrobiae bacterium]